LPPEALPEAPSEVLRFGRLGVLIVGAFFVAEGLLRAAYFHLGARTRGAATPLAEALVPELSASSAMVAAFVLIVLPACRRWPIEGARWPRHALTHVGVFVPYTLLKTFLMWAQRAALWPLVGLGRYDFGDLPYRVAMEASLDVLGYAVLVGAIHVWRGWQRTQRRRMREARLRGRLAEARLEALSAQLQPHFLFNTLNAISSVMYHDPGAADRLMSRLSDLLRANLSLSREAEVAVAEEMGLLERYLEIVRARFGERLVVTTDVGADARDACVPPLLLQPLVENAIRHTVGERPGPGHIAVQVRRADGRLRIEVVDDGPGIAGDPDAAVGSGMGLANTRDRLAWLHGEAASLELVNRAAGGLKVAIDLPFRRLAPGPPRPERTSWQKAPAPAQEPAGG
jgi:signal transduction histidine kinase